MTREPCSGVQGADNACPKPRGVVVTVPGAARRRAFSPLNYCSSRRRGTGLSSEHLLLHSLLNGKRKLEVRGVPSESSDSVRRMSVDRDLDGAIATKLQNHSGARRRVRHYRVGTHWETGLAAVRSTL